MRMLIVIVALVCTFVAPACAADTCGKGELRASTESSPKALSLQWTGTIRHPMADKIEAEFNKAKGRTKEVTLGLSSCGGDLPEVWNVAKVLRRIKATHRLETMVGPGSTCASACVPVFLLGQRRWGALTSVWLFHEVGRSSGKDGSRVKVNRAETEMLFQDYFLAAGVSEAWLNQLRIRVQHANYWQTGQNLWDDKSGIITDPIDNLEPRGSEELRY